jgi:hypothetical protein
MKNHVRAALAGMLLFGGPVFAADGPTITVPGGASGVPAASAVTSITNTTAQVVFAAPTNRRSFYRITTTSGSSDLGCTDNGVVPTTSNFSIRVYSGGFYEASWPSLVSNGVIQCIGITGTVGLYAVQYTY